MGQFSLKNKWYLKSCGSIRRGPVPTRRNQEKWSNPLLSGFRERDRKRGTCSVMEIYSNRCIPVWHNWCGQRDHFSPVLTLSTKSFRVKWWSGASCLGEWQEFNVGCSYSRDTYARAPSIKLPSFFLSSGDDTSALLPASPSTQPGIGSTHSQH